MFSREGSARTLGQNARLAGALAFVGGYANSCGFVVLGAFTSHATGNVGRFASEVAARTYASAFATAALVVGFFAGAFAVSALLESRRFRGRSRGYATALAIEALLLAALTLWPSALVLSFAMGMQNGLVTRLSGAVVRTTHVTGVVTDLGIESARWLRYARHPERDERPPPAKVLLLATILTAFVSGALLGAVAAIAFGKLALLLAIVIVAGCADQARRTGALA